MAQIDPRIALGVQAPRFENPLEQMAKMDQMMAGRRQNQLAELQLQQAQQSIDDENVLRGIYRQHAGSGMDAGALATELERQGLYKPAQTLRTNAAAQTKAGLEAKKLQGEIGAQGTAAEKAKIEQALQQFDVVGRLMGGVRDQATYDAARQQAAALLGPDAAARIPAVYDPATVEQNRIKALSIQEQLQARHRELTLAETKRHNLATEDYEVGPDGQVRIKPGVLEGKRQIAAAGATQIQVGGMTKGRTKVDEKFADEYLSWKMGGEADAAKMVDQLRSARQLLTAGNVSGPLVGNVPDAIGIFTNPKAIAAREAIEEVVQRNLRLVLGAQFTEREGERLIARAFNPRLSEAENLARLDRLIQSIEAAAQAKASAAAHFEKTGSLLGWTGKMPSMVDFEAALEAPAAAPGADPASAAAPGAAPAGGADPLGIRGGR